MAASQSEPQRKGRSWPAAVDGAYAPLLLTGLLAQLIAVALGAPIVAIGGLVVAAAAEAATHEASHDIRARLRRVGLGPVVRVLIRALLLAGAALAGSDRLVALAFCAGVIGLLVTARLQQWLRNKLRLEEPPLGVRNLGDDLELRSFLDRLRRRHDDDLAVICAVELPLALGLVAAIDGPNWVGLALIAVAAALLLAIAVLLVRRFRRFRTPGAVHGYLDGLRAAIRETGAEVIVYFSGDPDATYQLKQWLPVLERIRQPVLLLLRERGHLEQLPDLQLPTLYCRRHQDLEIALAADPKVVLYVGNAGRNMHFLRYARPKHVFLNHGDSDKVSSANPVVKIYDRLFVAGELAIDRYRAAGIDLPDDRFRVVGRPQLDDVLDRGRRTGAGPPTVLYAPTWEGYYEAADYSSLERMGVALVDAILRDHPEVRVVFKPHPMSGHVRPAAAAARERVAARLRAAGAPHIVAAEHPGVDLLDWFDRSDVLLSDISAVVTDWLHTDKPYLVTNPRGLDVTDFHERFPSHRAAYLVGRDLEGLEGLAAALGDDPLAPERAEMKRRVLGEHPDGPLTTFERELDEAIEWARRDAGRVVNTFSYD